ncbi:MAG: sulfate ABC transporter permease subunit CysT [Myxococcota bacterium]
MSTSSHALEMPGEAGRGAKLFTWISLLLLVGLPLVALILKGLELGPSGIYEALTAPATLAALKVTFWTASVMALVNAVTGTLLAWVLVRYEFPGKGLMNALVDLPFAIPTLVAGVMLVGLYGPQSMFGQWLAPYGIQIVFAQPAIVLALLFISVPFVVRAVEPVLMELDPAEEEAASTLGASRLTTFLLVSLPPLLPVILSGTIRSFARALGEFGSIVVVSGNIPHQTLTAPVFLYGEIESGAVGVAAAVSMVLVLVAFSLTLLARRLEQRLSGGRR